MGELDLANPSYYDEDSGTIKTKNVQVTALTASPANISGKVGDHVTVNVMASPDGATGTITATVPETAKAVAMDNGDGTWDIQFKQTGAGTVTFKADTVQTVVNFNVADA